MIDIPCVILSGGASKRMGEDKSLLPFQNFNTLIEYQYNKLSKIFSAVYISSKTNKFDFDAKILYDESHEIFSPMIALKAILSKIKSDKVFIITVDMPSVESKTFHKLYTNISKYDIVIAKDDEYIHNLCGIYSTKLLSHISKLLSKDIHKISTLIKLSQNYHEVFFSNNEQFVNINTKNDYYKLTQQTDKLN